MPILEMQKRLRELGRIRIGHRIGEKGRPEKLDRFRFTSPSQALIDQIAMAYQGTPTPWTHPDGRQQWEVITATTRIPIMLAPNPLTQWYELWAGGGCQRRCDGQTEQLADAPCLCDPDPEKRACKPTTRLNVVLRDIPGMGVWRLETHGWYAATELPAVAALIANAQGMAPAWLTLEERVIKQQGTTRRFIVPGLDIDVTPGQLSNNNASATPALPHTNQPAQLSSSTAPQLEEAQPDYLAQGRAATTLDELRTVWTTASHAGHLTPDLKTQLDAIGKTLTAAGGDVEELWALIVMAAPPDWTTPHLEQQFAAANHGTMPGSASPLELTQFLTHLRQQPVDMAPLETGAPNS